MSLKDHAPEDPGKCVEHTNLPTLSPEWCDSWAWCGSPIPRQGLQEPLVGRSVSAYAKTDRALNRGSFVSRLVSCLISRVVHGCMFIAKEIR